MLGLLAAIIGGFPFYARSKYFLEAYRPVRNYVPVWLGVLLLLMSFVIYILKMGVGQGLLIGTVVIPLAYCLLPLLFNLPRKYQVVLCTVLVFFVLIELLF